MKHPYREVMDSQKEGLNILRKVFPDQAVGLSFRVMWSPETEGSGHTIDWQAFVRSIDHIVIEWYGIGRTTRECLNDLRKNLEARNIVSRDLIRRGDCVRDFEKLND
ncbi:MAG: hypothetical protein ACW99U_19890 [Candidatus Thorarchaeota archaeon]|jgi:hypothetical protein